MVDKDDAPLEDLVARFLDLRDETGPALAPEAFAALHPGRRDALLSAIRAALEASALLPEPEPRGELAREKIGGYRLVREIGRGGMGIVFEAERDGRRFALKWLPNAPLLGARAVERVRREAAALARLDHPNVVAIRDSGQDDGAPYLVMDLVAGEPLSALVGRLSPGEAARIVATLARAVQAVHETGALHRDLKPQNVVVRPDGEPVLLDFGLVAADDLPSLTSTGDLLGTPRYMAPEQVRGLPADARTDVHALGMILYELATGRAVHEAGTRDRVLEAVVSGSFVAPRRAKRGLPRDLEKVMLVALALDPRRRYPTAAALAADLDRFLAGAPVEARPPGPLARAVARARRHPARAGFAVAALLLLAAAGAGLVLFLVLGRLGPGGRLSPDEVRLRGGEVAAAVTAHLDGRGAAATRAAAERALAIDAGHPVAAALRAFAAGEPLAPAARAAAPLVLEGLTLLDAGATAGAAAKLAEAAAMEPDPVLALAVAGIAAREKRDHEAAARDLAAAAAALPSSRRVAEELATVYRRTQQLAAADRELLRAIALEPERAALWVSLAQVRLQGEDLDAGLEAAREAVRLAGEDDPEAGTALAGLLDAKGDREAAREILRRVIARNPRHATSLTRLAISLDTDHRVAEAAAAYLAVIEVDPGNAFALACLANLHAGADRGKCRGCDAAYAAHPELIDPALAESYLVRAVAADAGKSATLVNTLLQVALKLERREAVAAELERLTAGTEKTPETLRLDWMLRRLRLAETAPK